MSVNRKETEIKEKYREREQKKERKKVRRKRIFMDIYVQNQASIFVVSYNHSSLSEGYCDGEKCHYTKEI